MITTADVLKVLREREAEASQAMTDTEDELGSDYDYHQGRYEAYAAVAAWLADQLS